MRLIILIFLIIPTTLLAFENPKIKINNIYIQKYEVTISEFLNFANKTNFKTEAEKQGFGYEYGAGWEKRKNWNYKTPYGKNPESLTEPAVHVSYFEAEQYWKFIWQNRNSRNYFRLCLFIFCNLHHCWLWRFSCKWISSLFNRG